MLRELPATFPAGPGWRRLFGPLIAAGLLACSPVRAATGEIVCTSIAPKKSAVDMLTKKHAILAQTCRRSHTTDSSVGGEFCAWADETLGDRDRCVAASVPWAYRVVLRLEINPPRTGTAELRKYVCFSLPEPASVDTQASVKVTPATIEVTSEKERRLEDRFSKNYVPFVIDRKTMKGGPGGNPDYRCVISGATGVDARR